VPAGEYDGLLSKDATSSLRSSPAMTIGTGGREGRTSHAKSLSISRSIQHGIDWHVPVIIQVCTPGWFIRTRDMPGCFPGCQCACQLQRSSFYPSMNTISRICITIIWSWLTGHALPKLCGPCTPVNLLSSGHIPQARPKPDPSSKPQELGAEGEEHQEGQQQGPAHRGPAETGRRSVSPGGSASPR
jgi:hypothetical protein